MELVEKQDNHNEYKRKLYNQKLSLQPIQETVR